MLLLCPQRDLTHPNYFGIVHNPNMKPRIQGIIQEDGYLVFTGSKGCFQSAAILRLHSPHTGASTNVQITCPIIAEILVAPRQRIYPMQETRSAGTNSSFLPHHPFGVGSQDKSISSDAQYGLRLFPSAFLPSPCISYGIDQVSHRQVDTFFFLVHCDWRAAAIK